MKIITFILAILMITLTATSCKKENIECTTGEFKYIRVEGVSKDGTSTFTPIVPVFIQ